MEEKYDCENILCTNHTENYFCNECTEKIKKSFYRIYQCEQCSSIELKEENHKVKRKYVFVKECRKCKKEKV